MKLRMLLAMGLILAAFIAHGVWDTAPATMGFEPLMSLIQESSAAGGKRYQWTESMTLSVRGDERLRVRLVSKDGPDGEVQRTHVALDHDTIQELEDGAEITASVQAVLLLLEEYMPLDPVKIRAANNAGKVSVLAANDEGVTKVDIKNYLKPGDQLQIEAVAARSLLKGVSLSSYLGDGTSNNRIPVKMRIDTSTREDGTPHQKITTIDVASPAFRLEVKHGDYKEYKG